MALGRVAAEPHHNGIDDTCRHWARGRVDVANQGGDLRCEGRSLRDPETRSEPDDQIRGCLNEGSPCSSSLSLRGPVQGQCLQR